MNYKYAGDEHSEAAHELQSFNYVISSTEKVNAGTGVVYDIDLGNLNNSHDEYLVEVLDLSIDGKVLNSAGYIILTAENFAENGFFCRNKLSTNESIIAAINVNDNVLYGVGGTKFKAKGFRMKKRVRFNMRKFDLDLAVSGTDINVGGDSEWLLTLKMTPICPC
jgi:hypothetical protein